MVNSPQGGFHHGRLPEVVQLADRSELQRFAAPELRRRFDTEDRPTCATAQWRGPGSGVRGFLLFASPCKEHTHQLKRSSSAGQVGNHTLLGFCSYDTMTMTHDSFTIACAHGRFGMAESPPRSRQHVSGAPQRCYDPGEPESSTPGALRVADKTG